MRLFNCFRYIMHVLKTLSTKQRKQQHRQLNNDKARLLGTYANSRKNKDVTILKDEDESYTEKVLVGFHLAKKRDSIIATRYFYF